MTIKKVCYLTEEGKKVLETMGIDTKNRPRIIELEECSIQPSGEIRRCLSNCPKVKWDKLKKEAKQLLEGK